jgi:alanine dehydrogenase
MVGKNLFKEQSMIIGVPREVKRQEFRVGLTPPNVQALLEDGNEVLIETAAGTGSGFSDEEYRKAGAYIVDKQKLFRDAKLIVKVKEPLAQEYDFLRNEQAIFTYLHLAPNRPLTEILLKKNITGIAYETLTKEGILPLLAPMSEIAGRMAPIMAAYFLQKFTGGSGILATGASGVNPAKIVVLGAGVVGTNSSRVALDLGMETVVMNKGKERLRKIDELFGKKVETLPLTAQTLSEQLKEADIIVGAILVPGGRTPILITRDMLKIMKTGSIIVDVSIDQGGCIETSKPTTHDDPVYLVDGILHYCVANMPGAYPRTSTIALTNATLPYIKLLVNKGIEMAIEQSAGIRSALNTYRGKIMNKMLADALGLTSE